MRPDPIDVAAVDDVPTTPPLLRVQAGSDELLLVRVGDAVHAVELACPHLGSPLTRGELDGTTLACPRHFYAYDLCSGQNTFPGDDADVALGVRDVEVRDGRVLVHPAPDA